MRLFESPGTLKRFTAGWRRSFYADHDEYITFLAHRKGQLSGIVKALTDADFAATEYFLKL